MVLYKLIAYFQDSNGIRQYIACQGPLKNTCIDMWQMVLDQDVASIVMLCQISEKDKVEYNCILRYIICIRISILNLLSS